jgi:transposase-like protein
LENIVITVTFDPETMDMNVDAPTLALDVVISFLQRALRQCENAEKVVVAQQVSAAVREVATNENRTKKILSNLKM